jgi:transposase InsO family protein
VACRVLKVSRSGYYEWRDRPPCSRDLADAYLANTVVDIHAMSRRSYGAPRVHAELRLGMGIRLGRKRVARLLRMTGRSGIGGNTHHKRRKRPEPAPHEDLVQRRFVADAPNRLWCTDVTEHPTEPGVAQPVPEHPGCVDTGLNRSLWTTAPGCGRRRQVAICRASTTRSARMWSAIDQPTTARLKTSSTAQQ